MRLYLIRHATAAAAASDRERPLSPEGIGQAIHLARRLRELGVRWGTLFTSPLLRARQTAAILHQAGVAARVDEAAELAPGGELPGWLPVLAAWRAGGRGDLGAVGHLPTLAAWAEQLSFGEARGRVFLPPAGLVALEAPDDGPLLGRCAIFWVTAPALLP